MFTKILFPTDFSEKSNHAMKTVMKLKEAGTETVVALHCVDVREVNTMADMEGFSSLNYDSIVVEINNKLKKRAAERLSNIVKELKALGFEVEERLLEGIPFKEILRVAEKEGIDLIVLGSTGKGLLSEMLLGSTSEKVVREAKCPVLVVK